MVNENCDDIEHQLRQLKEFSFRLGDSMERSAAELRTEGTSPSAELIAELQSYREVFCQMRSRLQGQKSVAVEVDAELVPATLNDLESKLTRQMARSRALALLDNVEGLTHVEGDQHLVVVVCQQACETARGEVLSESSKSRETIDALVHGVHPLAVLWNLVTQCDTLDDMQWTELLEQCATQLGREVATAVARHKLLMRETTNHI
jgi:hypothetical protein